jgi:hypothetical protein
MAITKTIVGHHTPVKIVNSEDLKSGIVKNLPPMDGLAKMINSTCGMLPVTAPDMEESFHRGLAVVGIAEQQEGKPVAVSYLKLVPLLDKMLKAHLSLPNRVPEIAEMRSLVIEESYRGNGVANLMNHVLLDGLLPKLSSGKLMVMALTKNVSAIKSIKRFVGDKGIPLTITDIGRYPMIEPFICDCTSWQQYESTRISLLPPIPSRTLTDLNQNRYGGTDCLPRHVVYIFYEDEHGGVATNTNALLRDYFHDPKSQYTRTRLITALGEVQYNALAPGYAALMRLDGNTHKADGTAERNTGPSSSFKR